MNILCVITGGTFGSNQTANGIGISTNVNEEFLTDSVNKYFDDSVNVEYITPIFKLSENIDDKDWNIINSEIEKNIDNHDCVLVVHGTDTMAYTSSALAFNEKISKKVPVVVTGANLPLSFEGTDAIVNFIDSIKALKKFIESKITGVFIVFNGTNSFNNKTLIHLGTRVKKDKWEESCYRSFYINQRQIGSICNDEFEFDFDIYNNLFQKEIFNDKSIVYNAEKVSNFKIYPGFDPSILKREFDYGKKYFILEIYNSGTAPIKGTYLGLSESLEYINKQGGIVFAVSQHEGKSGATMDIYESSNMLKEFDLIPLKDIVWESAVVKLMGASSLCNSNDEITKYMTSNISGEVI